MTIKTIIFIAILYNIYSIYVTADLGKVAKKYINDGRLVPDSFMIKFIHREIASAGSIPWLLDGNNNNNNKKKKLRPRIYFPQV